MDEWIRELFRGNYEAFEPKYSAKSRQAQSFVKAEEMLEKIKAEIPEEYHLLLDQYEKKQCWN